MQANISNYFYEFQTVESYTQKLLDLIASDPVWFNSNGLTIHKIEKDFFRDSVLFKLIEQFQAVPLLFKIDPFTWYDWHTDEIRECAVNMLVTGYNSHCFFGQRENRDIVHITELKYQPNRYYLLNTQEKHAILNLEQTRYVLSMGFSKPHIFYEILKFCKEHNL